MPRRNWPHRLRQKRQKHRSHRMKRAKDRLRNQRIQERREGDAQKEQARKQAAGPEAPEGVMGRKPGAGQEGQLRGPVSR